MSLLDENADRVDWQEDGTAIVTLVKPSPDAAIPDKVTVQRPLFQLLVDNEKVKGDDMLRSTMVVSALTGLSVAETGRLLAGDTFIIAEIFARMMEYAENETNSLLDRHADRITQTSFDAALTLRRPLTTVNGEVDEIVLRHPTLEEVRKNQGATMAASVKLMAILTGLGPNVLGKLDGVDGMILAELVNDFLGKPRRRNTGAL